MKKSILFLAFTLFLLSCGSNKVNENKKNNIPEKLVNLQINYTYSEGNSYALKFEEDGVSYQYRSGKSPDKWWGTFKYNHMITENNEHFVSWFEPGYGDYVTLLINFENDIIYGSAIIKGRTVHFQKAKIEKFTQH